MSTSLLHIADLHLDRAFAGMGCQGDLAIRRRLGLRDALQRAGRTAAEMGCAAITIGGDLYEHDRAGADTAAFLARTFASWQPMAVLVAAGNHDALLSGSIYSRTEWPANVHVFDSDALQPYPLADGVTVWGLSHREPAWQGNPLDIEPVSSQGVHLALFHGAEMGSRPDGKSVHGPFRASAIRERGFAAALCGHYHRRRLDDATGLVYPGSPEPLTFDETEPRGPVVVTVTDAGALAFQPLSDNRWHALTTAVDVGGAVSLTDIVDAAREAAVIACTGLEPGTTMLRLDLDGELGHAIPADTFTIESAVREGCGVAAVRVRDLTSTAVSVAGVASDRTVLGAFAREVAAAAAGADGEERRVLDDALRYGLQALSGAEVGLR